MYSKSSRLPISDVKELIYERLQHIYPDYKFDLEFSHNSILMYNTPYEAEITIDGGMGVVTLCEGWKDGDVQIEVDNIIKHYV